MIPEEMTLRDWFAGQALQGIRSNPDDSGLSTQDIVDSSWHYADKMMEARNNER